LPWNIGDFIFRNINKIDEFANHFNIVTLKYVQRINGFNPNKIFVEHMLAVGFSNLFIHSILEYNEEEIDNWLVDYSVKNQDIEEAIHGISLDLRDLEGELFNIKIRHEINVAPMKNYIEYWFKKAIHKLTKEGKEKVETVHVTINEDNKRTATRK
jgi:hypothetical protein